MAKKKIKRKPKKILIIILIIMLLLGGFYIYTNYFNKSNIKETKVVSKIPSYGYNLKSNKSSAYKKLFQELKTVLTADKVDEKKYAKVLSKMFIVDFYSLGDHNAKTDVGGVELVHTDVEANFIINAEDTLYKYVESDIYNQRTQKLPIVDKVSLGHVETIKYTYNSNTDNSAYKVEANWTYKDSSIAKGYQDEANLTFIHNGKKLVLVELSDSSDKEDSE